jgi:integrase
MFMAAYEKAMKAPRIAVGADRTTTGTMNALVVSFYGSPPWRNLAASTQSTYRGVLERLREEHGEKRVIMLERRHVKSLIDAKAQTPAAANRLLSLLQLLLDHALDQELVASNVARAVKPIRYKREGFHSWTEGDIEAFRKRHPLGITQRLAFELLLGTGQRPGDVSRMSPAQICDGCLWLTRQKTGAALAIPIGPELEAAMRAAPLIGRDAIIVIAFGKPFTGKGFQNHVKDACRAASPDHCSAHGLRKAAARRLADAGCSTHEIASITGHATLAEVSRYTKAADQQRLARSALGKLAASLGTPHERTT